MYPCLLTHNSVVVIINSKPYNADLFHPNFAAIVSAIKTGEWDKVERLINLAGNIATFTANTDIRIDHGELLYRGEAVHSTLATRIVKLYNDGFDVGPMVLFLDNLMENPSSTAVNELYGFLEKSGLPITEDGHFIAYKRVRDDYKSFHDGITANDIGTKLEMDRNKVDDNRNSTCSHGLHFCSLAYVNSFHCGDGRIVLLKINPRDVVSIPSDYDESKGRACKYTVVGEVNIEDTDQNMTENAFTAPVVNNNELSPVAVTNEFVDGYDVGYVAGRNKEDFHCSLTANAYNYECQCADKYDDEYDADMRQFSAGFERGYSDGRGHKARRFTNK